MTQAQIRKQAGTPLPPTLIGSLYDDNNHNHRSPAVKNSVWFCPDCQKVWWLDYIPVRKTTVIVYPKDFPRNQVIRKCKKGYGCSINSEG